MTESTGEPPDPLTPEDRGSAALLDPPRGEEIATPPEPQSLADLAHIAVFGWPCDDFTPAALNNCKTITQAVHFLLDSPRGRWDIREHVPLWPLEKWVATEFQGHRIWVDLRDRWVGFGVLSDDWENAEIDFMTRHLKPGDGMVDIGANIGVYTLAACRAVGPHGHVYAFEPMPKTSQMLGQSISENGYAQRCTVFPMAIGATDQRMGFAISDSNPGASHVSASAWDIEVSCRALDNIDLSRRIAFLKIDIEGLEPRFLEGARRTLAEHRPVILTEFYPRALREVGGSSARLYVQALGEAGYDCFKFDSGLGEPVTSETAEAYPETGEPINLICLPR